MRTVRTSNNGNRFIEQYKWTVGVCITVQNGKRGNFMDVQIGERGKQRVNIRFCEKNAKCDSSWTSASH